MQDYQDITLEVDGRIALLTLNQPQIRNPMGGKRTTGELVHAVTRVQMDDGISVLILTGAGSAFSAGGNLRELRERAHDESLTPIKIADVYRRGTHTLTKALEDLDVPTIAAVNGAAMGGGLDIALMCDIRLASTEAFFGETFLNLGSVPGTGGSWFLTRAVGYQHATRLTFMAEPIGAEEALEIGLVARVLEPDQLMPEAMALAGRIAAKPPRTLRLAKQLLKQSGAMGLNDFLDTCAAAQALAQTTADHREAVEAYFDKRDPEFKGR